MKLNEIFAQYGKTDLMSAKTDGSTRTYRGYQNLWEAWYKGYYPKFHRYSVYNGDKKIYKTRRALGMGKVGAERWASLLMNEKTSIVIADEVTNDIITDILSHNKFESKFNAHIEIGYALGIAAIVERIDGLEANPEDGSIVDCRNAKIHTDFINGKNIYPFTVDDDGIVEAAFFTRKGKQVSIQMHLVDENTGNYVIHSITGEMNDLGDISYDENLGVYSFDTQSPRKWFQIIKPNIVNNINVGSPLGVSIFANAIAQLETCDIIYDALPTEFELGKKRLYISADALKIDGVTGEQKMIYDPNDVLFYMLPTPDMAADKPYIIESNGELRVQQIEQGLQAALNILSTKMGFGEGQFIYNSGSITTATQVISQNSEMYRNVVKNEKLLTEVIRDVVKTICYILNQFTDIKVKDLCDEEIAVQYDDSIIEDKGAEQMRDMQTVSAGIMGKAEYRVKWFGETEEEANAAIEAIKGREPQVVDIFSNA